jgi:RTX calcium-binding nonapeptide repeat (4 copies)
MTSLNTHARALRPCLGVVLTAALALVMLFSSPAWAKTINGSNGDDIIVGSSKDDKVRAKDGNDIIFGGKGKDKIDCGRGYDVVVTDGRDEIGDDCETIKDEDA